MSAYQPYLVPILVVFVAALVLRLPTGRSRSQPGSSTDRQLADPVFRDEDQYWVGGFFYNNPDNPALFVPKRNGLGWTINFGHPQGKLLLIGTLLLLLVMALVRGPNR